MPTWNLMMLWRKITGDNLFLQGCEEARASSRRWSPASWPWGTFCCHRWAPCWSRQLFASASSSRTLCTSSSSCCSTPSHPPWTSVSQSVRHLQIEMALMPVGECFFILFFCWLKVYWLLCCRDDHAAVWRGGERVLGDLRVGVRPRLRRRDGVVRVFHVDTFLSSKTARKRSKAKPFCFSCLGTVSRRSIRRRRDFTERSRRILVRPSERSQSSHGPGRSNHVQFLHYHCICILS